MRNEILLLKLKHTKPNKFVLCKILTETMLLSCEKCVEECMSIFTDLCMGVFRLMSGNFMRVFVCTV